MPRVDNPTIDLENRFARKWNKAVGDYTTKLNQLRLIAEESEWEKKIHNLQSNINRGSIRIRGVDQNIMSGDLITKWENTTYNANNALRVKFHRSGNTLPEKWDKRIKNMLKSIAMRINTRG